MKIIDEQDIDTMLRFGMTVPQEFILTHVFEFTPKEIKKFKEQQKQEIKERHERYSIPENVIQGDFSTSNVEPTA